MRDIAEIIGVSLAVLGAAFLIIVGIVGAIDYLDCSGFERGTGIKTRWQFGCYAQTADGWVPKDYIFGRAHELRMKDKK
jgi:hypothetical protein